MDITGLKKSSYALLFQKNITNRTGNKTLTMSLMLESIFVINFCNQFDLLVNNEFVVMVFSGTDL